MDVSCAELKRAGSFNRGGLSEQEHGDSLAIEDLLDFSSEEIGGSIESYESNDSAPASSILLSLDGELKASTASSTGSEKSLKLQQPVGLLGGDVGGSGGELCVPCDDLADLEWLSNFVEESFSSGDGTMLEGVLHDGNGIGAADCKQAQRASPVSVLDHHRRGTHHSTSTTNRSSRVGGKHLLISSNDQLSLCRPAGRARSKRPRSAVCFWNTRILSITDDCNVLEASSTSKLTSQHHASSSSESEGTLTLGHDESGNLIIPTTKKFSSRSKLLKSAKGGGGPYQKGAKHAAVGVDRKCLHCGSQRTPQWRAGPMGPKTLCNACGVRYKSGRLLPEYRPAASPTFVESIHSNSHRRVLEMRRQRADAVLPSSCVNQLGVC